MARMAPVRPSKAGAFQGGLRAAKAVLPVLAWPVKRMPRLDGYRPAALVGIVLACVVLAGSGFVWFGHRAWTAFVPQFTPSCSWPLRVQGQATGEQAGLVRCYLQALAHGDSTGLDALAVRTKGIHITQADLTHSADARAGLATAVFTPSPVDTTYVLLTIRFADGKTERTGLMNMIAVGGFSAWRMSIGTGQ